MNKKVFTIWIEAEEWQGWNPEDDNTMAMGSPPHPAHSKDGAYERS